MRGMNGDTGYDVLELKEHIIDQGGDVSSHGRDLLSDARKYRPGLIESFHRGKLKKLDERYDTGPEGISRL
jgi:hypothetical protein